MLYEVITDVLDLYRDLKSGISVRGRVEPQVGEVWVDPEQIRRVLINLVITSYSIHYTKLYDTISLSIEGPSA